ncbi:NACHT domain-containing protein [Psychrobacter sp. APC 3426]|uniref:NACHT domain-containing protein n=1 Tax=Psychrobacter sp. APC 3426 TaxID=3035177 RepID=UPI0025B485D7|nr:NACHT domain-containing protein [Psychrobacter sp. APC 3426]MDN3399417.1 NACHT domain-containing protein [Psychrobacter sp. APC 3426]
MENKNTSQSPELAGGDGFIYEGHVMAFYLTALLAEASAPGCNGTVVNVASQQRDFGYPLDDVIIKWIDASDRIGTTSLQVKRDLTISSADTNKNFRDVIRDSLTSYQDASFNNGVDKYGVAVSEISSAKFRDLGFLCQIAVESGDIEHFEQRFSPNGNASADIKVIREAIYQLLDELSATPLIPAEKHNFLKHFIIVRFDFLHDGEVDAHVGTRYIQSQLPNNSNISPVLVWSHIYELGRESAGKAGQFDRVRLVHELCKVVKLKEGRTFEEHISKIKELTNTYLHQIQSDIDGCSLDRSSLKLKFSEVLKTSRFIQITGMPGTGKSALLRKEIESYLESSFVLFLKSDQLVGKNWAQYVQSSGIPSNHSLKELLIEIKSAGTPILFIDGIDRVDSQHRPIIDELISLILNDSLLTEWKIVVTLRETGLEPLRTWLGSVLKQASIGNVTVNKLDDNEANILSTQFPNLRSLLFSSSENVKHVTRTPFFAKTLSTLSISDDTSPESELDLIHEWWKRGGYSATSQKVIDRQNALLELAEHKVKNLSKPVKRRSLTSNLELDELNSDGVIRVDSRKSAVDFAHDIFFEWSLLYNLLEADDEWLDKIETFGQPPAIARVVELLAQQKLQDEEWSIAIENPKFKTLRSQWLRAWLLGAISYPNIAQYSNQFRGKLVENDYALYEKLLVWFQAEKTKPNPLILATSKDMRTATSMAWPSDLTLWFKVIRFILNDISSLPEFLYQQIIDVFSVFQNVTLNTDFSLELSSEILRVTLDWLCEIEGLEGSASTHNWKLVDDISEFKDSLRSLLITSTISNPEFIEAYLKNLLTLNEIPNDIFKYIIQFSGFIAQKHPELLVELCLKKLLCELPLDKYTRKCEETKRNQEYWAHLNSTPVEDRTAKQNKSLQFRSLSLSSFSTERVDDSDWNDLSINTDFLGFYPSSPIKEPFYSLLKHAPDSGLRLITELSNHAITAWQQLHELSDEKLTPIPITLDLPWGSQTFWGNEQEYIWSRPFWINNVLSSAFMALEKWCFEQLEAGANLDELIKKITKDHESVAILSVISVLILEQQGISKTILPLVTNQKVLDLDYYRFTQDIRGSSTPLISYSGKHLTHRKDIDEIKKIYTKTGYKSCLSNLLTAFIFSEFSDELKVILNKFKNFLPYDYEEQIDNSAVTEKLLERANFYAEYADKTTYSVQPTENENIVTISHHSSSLDSSKNIEEQKKSVDFLSFNNIAYWAHKSLLQDSIVEGYSIQSALDFIKEHDEPELFEDDCEGWTEESTRTRMKQNAIVAVATMTLWFRKGLADADLMWARGVINRAVLIPFNSYECSTSEAKLSFHPKIFSSKALASEIRFDPAGDNAKLQLLCIIASPVNEISISALNACLSLYDIDRKLTYSAIFMAVSMSYNYLKYRNCNSEDIEKVKTELQGIESTLTDYHESDKQFIQLPNCGSPWVELEKEKYRPSSNYHLNKSFDAIKWERSNEQWDTTFLSHILKQLPIKDLLQTYFKEELLGFIESLINWAIELTEPSWAEEYDFKGSRGSFYDFMDALGNIISMICSELPFSETYHRFVEPILALKTQEGWKLIEPLIGYCSSNLYDELIVSEDIIKILQKCLDRFLQIEELNKDSYRVGRFEQLKNNTLETLMFTRFSQFNGAKRFANENWSEINLILPIIDKLVREAGWVGVVMQNFVQLCEHAKNDYPAELFADQVLTVISKPKLVGWQGSTLYSKIAELVQFLAERDNPLNLQTGQKLLRIIDWLIDQGDRRSASLQQSELFRSIKVN